MLAEGVSVGALSTFLLIALFGDLLVDALSSKTLSVTSDDAGWHALDLGTPLNML